MCIDVVNPRKKKIRAVLCVFVSADLDLIIATTLRQISANQIHFRDLKQKNIEICETCVSN